LFVDSKNLGARGVTVFRPLSRRDRKHGSVSRKGDDDDGEVAFRNLSHARAGCGARTAQDLFGLHTPPERPHPSYRRSGPTVVALTAATAAIENPTGAKTIYPKLTERGDNQ
jgi:hypothetical protein